MKIFWKEQTVSEVTGLKLPTLRNHRHLGKGIPYVKFGRSVRYDPDDVFRYMERRKVDPEGILSDI
jgi:hypothetical protein